MSERENEADIAANLMRGLMKLTRRLRAVPRGGGLSLSAVSMLGALHRLGPMPAARLAEEQRLAPQSLSRLIPEMESKGLLRRARGKEDRRTLMLSITSAGVKMLGEEMRARRAWLDSALLETLTPVERSALRNAGALMEKVAEWPDLSEL